MSKKSSNFAAAKRLRFLEGEPLKAIRIAYMPSENVLPRTRVPRSPTAPQRFNRAHTILPSGRVRM